MIRNPPDPPGRDADGHTNPPGQEANNACAGNQPCAANKQGQADAQTAQNKKDPPKPDPKTKPEKGGNAGLTVGGTALLGVGKAGASGTVSGSAVVMHNSDTGNVWST